MVAAPLPGGPRAGGPRVYGVAELSAHVKRVFEADPVLANVWVTGEVSNCRPVASGHWYWTLKDDEGSLRCVMWKGVAATQRTLPEDGARVVLHGNVSVYVQGGQYQLYVDHIDPVGLGDLHRAFEELKARLLAEGLFDPARKRPLPPYPRVIGVVTSADAAALRDICHVLARRWPGAEVRLAATPVQGAEAPPRIVSALATIGRAGVDVVIVARGGGSLEDLWAFNDEAVARAIVACPVPVVTGIGHETDVTIADFAADVRAPTPSAAAELATPDARELAQTVDGLRERLSRRVNQHLRTARADLTLVDRRIALAAPARTIVAVRTAVAERRRRMTLALAGLMRVARADLGGAGHRLEALSPQATLNRGYSHVRRRSDGATVRSAAEAPPGTGLDIRVADGTFPAVVEGQAPLFEP